MEHKGGDGISGANAGQHPEHDRTYRQAVHEEFEQQLKEGFDKKTSGPTPNQQVAEINPKKSKLKTRIVRGALSLAALGGLGFAAYQNDMLPIHSVDNAPVPTTFVENIDTQALNHALGKDGTPLDQLPTVSVVAAAETRFQAKSNGTTVSAEEMSSLLKESVKPFDKETRTAKVSLLFPAIDPGEQKIIVSEIANCIKGTGQIEPGRSGPGIFINWEKIITYPNKNSEIPVSAPNAEVFKVSPKKDPSGKQYFNGIVVRFTGPDKSKYELFIRITGNVQTLSFDSILPAFAGAPEIGEDGFYGTFDPKYSTVKGLPLPAETPILKTINNNGSLSYTLYVDQNARPVPFDFISSQGKIVYSP